MPRCACTVRQLAAAAQVQARAEVFREEWPRDCPAPDSWRRRNDASQRARRLLTSSHLDPPYKHARPREARELDRQEIEMTEQNPVPARVRVSDPGGILSVVPLLLGYEPADGDLVTLGISGQGRVIAAARMQAGEIDRDSAGQLRQVFGNFRRSAGVESAIVVGYGKGEVVTPAVDRLVPVAAENVDIRDVLRVEGNRYWSYGCSDLECCPTEGREFGRETAASTTLRAVAGLDAAPSREAIAARVAGPASESARQAWDRAASERVSLPAGRRQVRQALQSSYDGGQLSDDDVARLAAAMRALPVRDDAWARMTPERSAAAAPGRSG